MCARQRFCSASASFELSSVVYVHDSIRVNQLNAPPIAHANSHALGRGDVFICLQKFFGDVVSSESAEGASPSGIREWRARERSDPRASPALHRATRRAHSEPVNPSDVEGKTRGRPDPVVKSARVCDACAGSCAARATRSTTTWGPRPRARLSSTTPSRRYVHASTRTTRRPEPVANGPPSRPAPRPRGE